MLLRDFSEINKGDVASAGGKGASLGEMTQSGIPVPPGFILTTDAYKEFGSSRIPEELKAQILARFDQLDADLVAVRSSATAEDSADASWAGQFESYLNVARDQLIVSIEKCWESASSVNVQAYADQQATEKQGLSVAVVVQQMINGEVSGVAFSVNPITKNHDEIMIEAAYGLGELLVQGMASPDNYTVNKQDLLVSGRQISQKSRKLVLERGSNVEVEVPEHQQNVATLDEAQLKQLSQIVIRIESHYGSPQDIEWAYQDGEFFIVQSRPITTLGS